MAMIKTRSLEYRATKIGAKKGESQVREPRIKNDRIVRGIGLNEAAWRDGYSPDPNNAYYSRPYVLNTKYVVDAEEHPSIGCIVTLTSGAAKHVDLDVERIFHEGNRR